MALLLILVALLFGFTFPGAGSGSSSGSAPVVPDRVHANAPPTKDRCIGGYAKGSRRRPRPAMPRACVPQLLPGRSP